MLTKDIFITDDEPASYLIRRVADSEADALRAEAETRELDHVQRKRGQKKPLVPTPQPVLP